MLRIKPDGSLQQAEGSPVWSGGVNPVSIAVSGGLVYVANAGPGVAAGDTNITGFTLNPGGHLRPIAGSTVTFANDTQPGDVLFNGDGSRLVVALVNSSQLASFTVGSDGLLTASGPLLAAQGLGPFGSEFLPTDPTKLFVSNAHNGPGLGTVSAFTDGPGGVLTPIGASPFANLDTAPCWVEISHDGQYLFTVNTAGAIDLALLDRQRRLADPDRHHAVLERCRRRRRGCAPLARRLDALGRRGGAQHRRRLLGQRRQPHRADRLAVRGRARRDAFGHRRHLGSAR